MLSLTSTSLLLGVLVFLFCSWLVRRPKNLPPGPWSLPIVGYRFGPGLLHEYLTGLAQKYGPVMSLRRGPFLFAVLSDRSSLNQALVKQAEFFSDRFLPGHIAWGIPDTDKNASVVWSNGKPWLDLRRSSLSTLRSFGFGKRSLEPQINLEARYLCEVIEKLRGSPASLVNILNKATANIISQLVFGHRFEYDDGEFNQALQVLFEVFVAITDTDPVVVFPSLIQTRWYKHYREVLRQSMDFCQSNIKGHRESFQKENIRDFIDAFLADGTFKDMSLRELSRIVLDLFAAGTETTSVFLLWAILYLAVHQDVQKKVQTELDVVVGRGRQPSMSDRPSLPFCEATVKEIMRIRSVLPLSLPHMTSGDVRLGRYTIPKGTIVIPNLWAVHHDPTEWRDPDVFDPERFLEDGGRKVKKIDAWMPFGIGRRECLGIQLAKMEAFLLFANLFQNFEFKLPSDQSTHSLRGVTGLTMQPKPFKVCALER